jgi:PAS domain S-box-containing protein
MPNPGESNGSPLPESDLLHLTSDIVHRLRQESQWEQCATNLVKELGLAIQASWCFICELQALEADACALHLHSEWHAESITPCNSSDIQLPVSAAELQEWQLWKQISRGATVEDLTACPEPVLEYLRARQIKSLLCAPIIVGREFWGWLGVDDCSANREWCPTVSDTLHLVASALGAVIEQQQTELERARVSAMFENSEDAIIGKTLDGMVTQWNVGAERIYGYSADEMIGSSITRLIPEDLHDEFQDIMRRLKAGQRIEHHQTRRIRKDGTELAISLSISPIYDQADRIAGAVTIARDITESKQAEIALRASEERLRLALDAGEIGAWDWNIDTSEVVWSSNMELLHGMEPGTFDGTFDGFRQGIHPDDYERVLTAIQRALRGEAEYELEYRSLRSNGTYQWLSTHGSVVHDENGRPRRMTSVCYDVTPRKQAEAAQFELLAQVQRARAEADAEALRLRELFQHAPAMMSLLEGADHVFALVNDHYLAAIGNRDVLNKPILEALPELENQGLVNLLDTVYQTGKTITRSELPVMVDHSGEGKLEERFFSFAYQPFFDVNEDITGVLVHAVDLTDHIRARQRVEQLVKAVASERDRLQQVVDVMPEGVAICNVEGEITLSNVVAREIWGQVQPTGGFENYEQLRPLTLDLIPYPVDDLPLTRSVRSGETVLGEQMVIQNAVSGEHIYVLVNSAALKDGSGNIIGGVAVFQDIRSLREFERQKDEFLQAVTHDLKNPLTTILGNVQLLHRMESFDPNRVGLAAANIDSAVKRALALVEEILDLTRQQMGRPLEMSAVPLDLVELVNRITEQHQSTTDAHQIVVEAGSPSVIGEWDKVRLERVIANLVSNAVNYSPGGGRVTVRVRHEITDQRDAALVEVEDEGLGIPSHELPRLFERFWRGSNVREQVPGTGLGLAGVKAIVEAHNGEIFVESVEGQGSTFTIHLPRNVSALSES